MVQISKIYNIKITAYTKKTRHRLATQLSNLQQYIQQSGNIEIYSDRHLVDQE